MPTFDRETGQEVSHIDLTIPNGMRVDRVEVRNQSVVLFDADDNELMRVDRDLSRPGAGLGVEFGSSVDPTRVAPK